MSLEIYLIILVLALITEAFFSGSEMALISCNRLTLRKLAQKDNPGAKLALEMLQHPEHLLSTTLVGTNFCIALQAIALTLFIHKNYGATNSLLGTLLVTPLILLFGELIPKTLFQRYAERAAPHVVYPLRFFQKLLLPVTWLIGKYTSWLSKKLQPLEEAVTGRLRTSHRDELRFLLSYGKKETKLKSSERKMIRRILDFSKAETKNALNPLVNVDALQDSTTLPEALASFKKYAHSRLPVYHGRVDNIVGILHSFDLFTDADISNSSEKRISELMKPAYYAPETQKLDDLFYNLQKRGIQMAIVVDEYGGAVGIITIEDILEEIVGEIQDEYDEESAQFKEFSDNEFLVQGRMEIEAINDLLKLNLPHGDYETLAGFLLQQFNRIPEEGDELYYGNLKFIIRKASHRMIKLVHITNLS